MSNAKNTTTKPATKRAAKPAAKPAAKRAPRTTKPDANVAISAVGDLHVVCGGIAEQVRGFTDATMAHDSALASSAERVEALLAEAFPSPARDFGMNNGKAVRITGEHCPLEYRLLWAAFFDGVKTLSKGKVEIVNADAVRHRENAWSAALARVRGDIPVFEWNLSRARAKMDKAPSRVRSIEERILEKLTSIIEQIQKAEAPGKCVDILPNLLAAVKTLK